jgi:hypothetical protein
VACFESWPWAFPVRGEASHKALIAPEAPAQNGAHLTQISLGVGKNQKWKVDGVDGVFFRITRFDLLGLVKRLVTDSSSPVALGYGFGFTWPEGLAGRAFRASCLSALPARLATAPGASAAGRFPPANLEASTRVAWPTRETRSSICRLLKMLVV